MRRQVRLRLISKMQPRLEQIQRLEISSSLVKAYMINMGKAFFFVVAMAASIYLIQYYAGADMFKDAFDTIGLPIVWLTRAVVAFIGIFFLITIFSVVSLTSYSLIFEGDNLTYTFGSFFKVTKSTPIANIVRVNYVEYYPWKLGDIIVELTGTEEKSLKVQYVSNSKFQCELVNKLINLKKADLVNEISARGVV